MFSRKEKLIIAAILFCVFVTGSLIPLGSNWMILRSDQSNSRYAEYYHSKCDAENAVSLTADGSGLIGSTGGDMGGEPHEPKPSDPPQKPDYCDLAAQYLAARSAEASSYWSAWTFGATFVGVMLLWITLRETRAITKITRDIGIAQVRAYLDFNPTTITLTPLASDSRKVVKLSVKIIAEIRNVGSSPALEFFAKYHTIIRVVDGGWWMDRASKAKDTAKFRGISKKQTVEIESIVEIPVVQCKLGSKKLILSGLMSYETVFGDRVEEPVFGEVRDISEFVGAIIDGNPATQSDAIWTWSPSGDGEGKA